MRHFCSYFDHRYLERGMALYDSLARGGDDFRLYVLCLDDVCYDALRRAGLDHVVPIALPEIEAYDADLHAARARRSIVEFYFTLTPALPLFLLARHPDIELITYLDSDLFFFDDFERVFDEIGDASIAIIGHRFSETGRFREKYGLYNVGWVSWRRDESGMACLESYRRSCLEWCYDHADEVRFADQKYLDAWPAQFANVRVIEHVGCNLAPWNLENYTFANDDGRLTADGKPVVFYHFQGLKDAHAPTRESTSIEMYATRPIAFDAELVIDLLYRPYSEALTAAKARVAAMDVRPAPSSSELRHTEAPPSATPASPWRAALDWRAPEPGELAPWPHRRALCADRSALPPRARDFAGALMAQVDSGEMFLELVLRQIAATGVAYDPRVLHWSHDEGERGRLERAWVNVHAAPARIEANVERAPVSVFGEAASEFAVFERLFARAARAGEALILDGVRTFTFQPTRAVQRRVLGESAPRPIWILNRADLELRLNALGYRVARDLIWDESAHIPPLPERADRRTILALRAPSEDA